MFTSMSFFLVIQVKILLYKITCLFAYHVWGTMWKDFHLKIIMHVIENDMLYDFHYLFCTY